MGKITVFVADDHAMLRAGFKLLIDNQPDMEVKGESGDAALLLREVLSANPMVLTLDWSMPGGNQVQLIGELAKKSPNIRVLVVTMHDDPAFARLALAAGAAGFLSKGAADSELIKAIRMVAEGGMYAHAPRARHVEPDSGTKRKLENLSAREREVLAQVSKGHTNQAIADQLFLSVKTVESYRARLMGKLGFKSRAELTRFALDTGVISSETSGISE